MPSFSHRTVLEVGIVDKIALAPRPADKQTLFPVLTASDGNCVARSLSFLSRWFSPHFVV